MRNKIVHGDLEAEPTKADVELLLSVVAVTLAQTAELTEEKLIARH